MGSLPKTHPVTYEEWLEMPQSEGREEVVNGEIIPMPLAPQLAVEILSPSETRRLTDAKLRDYESISLPEVWIVAPEGETLELLQLEGERLVTRAVLRHGILKPRAFPHVEIDIAQIWPD